MTTAEICQCCQKEYFNIYRIPDDIWLKIMGKSEGLLCLSCCDVLAKECGIELYWEAQPGQFFTEERKQLQKDIEHESDMASMHHRHFEHLQNMGKKNRKRIQELEIERKQLKARIKELEKNTHLLDES